MDHRQGSTDLLWTAMADRLNRSSADCAISGVKNRGPVHTFTSSCKVEGERQIETVTLKIADRKRFTIIQAVDGRAYETA